MTSPPPPLQVLLQTMQESLNQRMQAGKRRYLVKSPSSSSPSPSKSTADFASNDYLSLATNAPLQGRIESAYRAALMGNCNNTGDKVAAATVASSRSGSTGSRLISGNSDHAISLETLLLNFHHPPIISSSFVTLDCNERVPYEALLFNSGYTANLGLFGCIGQVNLTATPPPQMNTFFTLSFFSEYIHTQKHDAIFYDELVHASIHDGLKASRVEFQTSFKHNDIQDLVSKITQFLDRNSSSLKSTPAGKRL